MLIWPIARLSPRAAKWGLHPALVTGGVNIVGVAQVGKFDGGGLWTCTLEDIRVNCRSEHKTWRALQVILQAGVTPIELGTPDWICAPTFGDYNIGSRVPFSDDATFSDGSMFVSEEITAEIIEDADLRDTVVRLNLGGATLEGGERFSIIVDEIKRMHQIGTVTPIGSGGDYEVTFMPPLRGDIQSGLSADFNDPACTMVLSGGEGGEDPMAILPDYGRYTDASLSFQEYFRNTDGA